MATRQILLNGVDAVDEDGLVRLFIKHDPHGDVARHFVLQTGAINQTHSHVVSKVDIVAQDVRVDQLPNVLASVVRHQVSFQKLGGPHPQKQSFIQTS